MKPVRYCTKHFRDENFSSVDYIFFCCCIKSLSINICGSMKAAKSVSTIFCTIPKIPTVYTIYS